MIGTIECIQAPSIYTAGKVAVTLVSCLHFFYIIIIIDSFWMKSVFFTLFVW